MSGVVNKLFLKCQRHGEPLAFVMEEGGDVKRKQEMGGERRRRYLPAPSFGSTTLRFHLLDAETRSILRFA